MLPPNPLPHALQWHAVGLNTGAPLPLVLRAPLPLHALRSPSDPRAPMQAGSYVAILHGGAPLRGTGERCPLGSRVMLAFVFAYSQYDP